MLEIGSITFQYWIEFLFGVLAALMVAGYRWVMKKFVDSQQEQKTIKNGIQALLRDCIIQRYNHYTEKGFCPIYALENIHDMFREYTALDGNGTIAKLVKELEDLPREKAKTKKEEKKL